MALTHVDLKKWLQGVAELSSAVNQSADLSEILDLVAETACRLMGLEIGAILLPDKSEQKLIIEGSYGMSQRYIDAINTFYPIHLRRGEDQAPSARAYTTLKPVQVNDTESDPTFEPWSRLSHEQRFVSMIAVPLAVSGQALGTLNHYTTRSNEFSTEELELLATLANQAALAITTSRLRAIEVKTIEELREMNNTLEEQHALLRQSDEVHQRLTEVVLSEGGVSGVAEALSELLDRPIVVDDPSGGVIAAISRHGQTLDIPVPEEHQRDDRTQWFAQSRQSGFPYDLPNWAGVDIEGPRIMVPILLGDEMVARMWLPGQASGLQPLDLRALEHAGTVLALEQLRLRAAKEAEWRSVGELISDLMTASPTAAPALSARARNLGLDSDQPHVILILKTDLDVLNTRARILTAVRSVSSALGLRTLVAGMENFVVALWPLDETGETVITVADRLRATYSRIGGTGTISVSISPQCMSASDYPRAFRISRGALELSQMRGRTSQTVTLDELGPYALLLQLDDIGELMEFARKTLGMLYDYDARRGTSLLETLTAFLRHNRNTAETAEELFVHPNTVGLRIKRVEELLDISLNETDALVELGLALMLEEVVSVGIERLRP